MEYCINFGYLDVSSSLFEDIDKDSEKVGIHNLIDIGFDKLSGKISDNTRSIIFEKYNEISNMFLNVSFTESDWVCNYEINRNKGYSYRLINDDFLDKLKKINGGRDFIKSIKGEYMNNNSYPSFEISFINNNMFRNSLIELSSNTDMDYEMLDFVKWAYWWGSRTLSELGDKSMIRFSEN